MNLRFLILAGAGTDERLRRAAAGLRTEIERALGRGGAILEREVKRQLSLGPRDVTKRGRRLERFRFSTNPTEHLRVRTDRLRGSVASRFEGGIRPYAAIRTGPQRVPYARIHEFGGHTGRGAGFEMRPRPYLAPAIRETSGRLAEVLSAAYRPLLEA